MKNKTILPENDYSYTVSQCYHNEPRTILYICFTIDTGGFKRRNVIEEFPTKEGLRMALDRFTQCVNFEPHGEPVDINFPNQFLGLRVVGTTVVVESGGAWVNKIKEYHLPEGKPEINVLEPKSDDHYYTANKKKKLPIL